MKAKTLNYAARIALALASFAFSASLASARETKPSGLETKVTGVEQKTENKQEQQKKKIVVLDPGHGMGNAGKLYDPGAVSGEFKEAEIVLGQAKKIKKILESRGYEVYLTRNNSQENVPLSARTEIAEKLNADAFVSLHCDSVENKSAYGQKVYPGVDKRSKLLAQYIQSELIKEIGKSGKFKIRDRGIKSGNFRVLNTNIPAVLVEPGFLSNDNDRAYLTDVIDDVEIAVANGIDGYLKLNGIMKERLKVYDGLVNKYVNSFNKSLGIELDSDLIRAIIFKEYSANKTNDPMQIANSVCPALEVLANGRENTYLIGDFSRLKGKTKSNMTMEDGIYGGIGWFIHKAAIYGERIVEGDETAFYTIKEGDTLWGIAKTNGATVSTLMEYNPGIDARKLKIDKKLMIKPAKKEVYIKGWNWENAVGRYGPASDKDYADKVDSILEELKDS